MADGLIPLPTRHIQCILALEFVGMAKLFPEAWLWKVARPESASGKCCVRPSSLNTIGHWSQMSSLGPSVLRPWWGCIRRSTVKKSLP